MLLRIKPACRFSFHNIYRRAARRAITVFHMYCRLIIIPDICTDHHIACNIYGSQFLPAKILIIFLIFQIEIIILICSIYLLLDF